MSSIKNLKKEINCLTEQFAADGFALIAYQPEKREDVISLISDAISLRNEQVYRLNHMKELAGGEKPSKFLAGVRKDFFGRMHELFVAMSDLSASDGKKSVNPKKSKEKTKE